MSSSISVAVRVRPFSEREQLQLNNAYDAGPALFLSDPSSSTVATTTFSTPQPPRGPGALRKILKVLDDRILVFDPPETNAVASFQKQHMPAMGKKVKDIRFCFDRVFDDGCGQEEVYDGSAKELVGHVMDGFHSTVFAYGATGCGKTHTISGSSTQPGIVFLIMKDLFSRIAAKSDDVDFSLTVSYLEIYNESIRDLLAPESGVLQLRDSQDGMPTPAGLSTKEPTCAQDVVEWITLGNNNRQVNATEANATSSRSHAVLRVMVTQKPKAGGLTDTKTSACLSVIDLAGSERASATKNRGERMTEGSNINRSLLALGNCINALCDPRRRGHVPYRDSKLTRLLKQSLGGNCKTVMIVCVSPSSGHYDETHNTLQYANRAKEIKTKAVRNVISVDRHVAQYCQQIMEQSQQIERLKVELASKTAASAQEDRAEDERAVSQAVSRLQGSWDSGKLKKVVAERAGAEKAIVDGVIRTLQHWQLTALSDCETGSPGGGAAAAAAASTVALLKQECQDLVDSLATQAASLWTDTCQADGAMDAYLRAVTSAKTSLRSRPTALSLFAFEAQLLDSRAETASADARSQGAHAGFAVRAQAMRKMLEARVKVGVALESAREVNSEALRALTRLANGVDKANNEAFAAFAGDSAGQLFPSSSTSSAFTTGIKRDAGSRSPLVPDYPSWDKVARLDFAGVGSAPTGSYALPAPASIAPSPMRARRSPRKNVSFHASARRAASPAKKGKGVQWRDEVGEGWDLEDVKYGSPDVSMIGETSFPSIAVSSPTSSKMWTVSSTFAAGSESSKAAEMMAQKARTASGSSVRNKLSSAPSLAPVSEGSTPFSFLPSPPNPASTARFPLSELDNSAAASSLPDATTSFSMAPTSSGLIAPLVASSKPSYHFPPASSFTNGPSASLTPSRRAARRVSHIGPLRSAKSTRRTSFAAPIPPPTSSSAGDASFASSSGGGNTSTTLNAIPLRKPGRVSSSTASSSTSRASLAPLPHKSPRKLGGHSATRGVASRRLSTLPSVSAAAPSGTSSAGLVSASSAPAPVPFGQKSAARIAARRASSLTGSAGNNSGSGAAALGLGLPGKRERESPPQAGAAGGVWR
ncbi:hypothetical protein JCM11641_002423 [Rhodosporidiobolus odoratus]